jgi:hypothetical protein
MVFVCNAYVDIDAAHGVVLECWVGFGVAGEIVLWRETRLCRRARRLVLICANASLPGFTQPLLSSMFRILHYKNVKLSVGGT